MPIRHAELRPVRSASTGWFVAAAALVVLSSGCDSARPARPAAAGEVAAAPAMNPVATPPVGPRETVNPLAYDRGVWQQLLSEAPSIRRVAIFTPDGVRATTESDDPAVVARIKDHAFAMQARMKHGSRVRMWDPIFVDLFARHDAVQLEVVERPQGVSIVEWSGDPEVVALLWSHAAGVSDFVREGHAAGRRETLRLAGGSAPSAEVAVGGVQHRLLLAPPTPDALRFMASIGAAAVFDLRGGFDPGSDEIGRTIESLGLVHAPLGRGGEEANDAHLDRVRRAFREADAQGTIAVAFGDDGAAIAAPWIAHRVLDRGTPVDRAIAEARLMGLDAEGESRMRAWLAARRHRRG